MAERDNICKQIHMPLQAGNTRVLDKMNRTYTKEELLGLVDEVRTILPDVNFSTDIIVGFPTETAEEFEDTLDVVRKVRFDSAFTFKYSPRPNTYAYKKLEDDVSEDEKTRRIMILNEVQRQISFEKNQAQIGSVQEILIEECSTKKSDDDFQGRNSGNQIVIVPKGPYEKGDYIKVTITDATVIVLNEKPF